MKRIFFTFILLTVVNISVQSQNYPRVSCGNELSRFVGFEALPHERGRLRHLRKEQGNCSLRIELFESRWDTGEGSLDFLMVDDYETSYDHIEFNVKLGDGWQEIHRCYEKGNEFFVNGSYQVGGGGGRWTKFIDYKLVVSKNKKNEISNVSMHKKTLRDYWDSHRSERNTDSVECRF